MNKINQLKKFIESYDVKGPKILVFLHSILKIFYISIIRFLKDKCPIHASALTYSVLLSLVPVLALMFSVLKGLSIKASFREMLIKKIAANQTAVAENIMGFLENVNAAKLGTVGAVALVVTAILVLTNIEKSFNHIWGITNTRKTFRKLADYLSVLIVGPLMFVGAMSVTALISLPEFMSNISVINLIYAKMLSLTPYIMLWLAFTFFYIFIPNTKVTLKSGLFGGFFASVLWQLAQLLYIKATGYMVNYQVIYGSLAALPIFLIWIYISWLILLFGAELSFAFQNEKKYRFSFENNKFSEFEIVQVCIIIMYYITKKFYDTTENSDIINVDYLSEKFNVSENIINHALSFLLKSKLIIIDNSENEEILPHTTPEKITVKHIFDAVINSGNVNIIKEFDNYIDDNLVDKLNIFKEKDFILNLNFEKIIEEG